MYRQYVEAKNNFDILKTLTISTFALVWLSSNQGFHPSFIQNFYANL